MLKILVNNQIIIIILILELKNKMLSAFKKFIGHSLLKGTENLP